MLQDADAFDSAIRDRFAKVVRDRSKMHAYQDGPNGAVAYLRANPFSALFVDLGLGKTISSLTMISDLILENIEERVLVIAPLKVACNTWPNEFRLWQHTAWIKHTLIRADDDDPRVIEARALDRKNKVERDWQRDMLKSQRLTEAVIQQRLGPTFETRARWAIMEELARRPTSVHVINREQVEWLCGFWKAKWPYRTVFIDESSSFKDHATNRFKELAKTRRTPGAIKRLHLLTATPAAEGYLSLWAQMYLLDLGQRLGKNITAFRDRYFIYNRYTNKYTLREGCEEEILSKIADLCLVMKQEDYLPRDKPTIIQVPVQLSKSELDLYQKLEKHFVVTLPSGDELEAKTASCLSSMLLQMASGFVYETVLVEDHDTDDLKKIKRTHHVHDNKIETLREIYEEAQNQGTPLLVAYHFKPSLARLKKAFPEAVVMDRSGKAEAAWTEGKIPMLLIHPQSAGHGLNLQYGGNLLVFYDVIFSYEYYLQTIGRIDRQGQTKPVIVKLLVATGTRDEDAIEALDAKEQCQDRMFALLKRLIRKHRPGTSTG